MKMNTTLEVYNQNMKELDIRVNNCSYPSIEKSVSSELLSKANKQAEELIKKIGANFDLKFQLRPILLLLNFDLKDKIILDLGCGSSGGGCDASFYEPYLCRALYDLGANPIGIDIGDLKKEKFNYKEMDLLNVPLSFIKDNSVDLTNANGFFDSPGLSDRIYESYSLLRERGMNVREILEWKFRDRLFPELKRVIKSGDFFIYDSPIQ